MRNDQSFRQILGKHETKCWVVGWEGTKVQIEAYKVIILEARERFEWENVVLEAIESEVWVWVKFQGPMPKQWQHVMPLT